MSQNTVPLSQPKRLDAPLDVPEKRKRAPAKRPLKVILKEDGWIKPDADVIDGEVDPVEPVVVDMSKESLLDRAKRQRFEASKRTPVKNEHLEWHGDTLYVNEPNGGKRSFSEYILTSFVHGDGTNWALIHLIEKTIKKFLKRSLTINLPLEVKFPELNVEADY